MKKYSRPFFIWILLGIHYQDLKFLWIMAYYSISVLIKLNERGKNVRMVFINCHIPDYIEISLNFWYIIVVTDFEKLSKSLIKVWRLQNYLSELKWSEHLLFSWLLPWLPLWHRYRLPVSMGKSFSWFSQFIQ